MKRSLCLLAMSIPLLLGATLPEHGPVPSAKPAERTEPAPEAAAPGVRSAEPEAPAMKSEQPGAAEVPAPLPKPEEKPARQAPATTITPSDGPKPDGKEKEEDEAEAPPPPPPLVKEDPEELKACLAELSALGAKFEAGDPIDDGNGCGIEHPVEIAEVLPGVDLGGATMRCKTAATMAHWLKDTVQPAMNIAMPGRKIVGISPGSTYACRLRNGASTGKISEHARGNAIDVAAFRLDNGETMEMKPRDEDSTLEGAFQRTATAGACLHFTTVLSPGSDAAHQNHLHLDVLERKDGYRYCR
ncbi:extensin family protein [Neorhizobium petrolearium]|uniref:extensin-like domain-containing protein n=1 Tax=Neorhizobium petrolearium TaxID=515361 RepID=UPI003F807893